MATEQGWAVKSPDGRFVVGIYRTRERTIGHFIGVQKLGIWSWKSWYRKGYRAVRVQITDEFK